MRRNHGPATSTQKPPSSFETAQLQQLQAAELRPWVVSATDSFVAFNEDFSNNLSREGPDVFSTQSASRRGRSGLGAREKMGLCLLFWLTRRNSVYDPKKYINPFSPKGTHAWNLWKIQRCCEQTSTQSFNWGAFAKSNPPQLNLLQPDCLRN